MSKQQEATPRPWSVQRGDGKGELGFSFFIRGGAHGNFSDYNIACVFNEFVARDKVRKEVLDKHTIKAEANAALIVQAVNLHDKYEAVAKAAEDYCNDRNNTTFLTLWDSLLKLSQAKEGQKE